jgi:hypothetical protein
MKALSYLALITGVLFLGFTIGTVVGSQKEKQYTLKPYTGLGSGVLAPGTVLKENYKSPASVIGKVDGGVWIIEEVSNDN